MPVSNDQRLLIPRYRHVGDYNQQRRLPAVYSEYFEASADWSTSSLTVAEDTTNVRMYGTNKKSVSFTGVSGTNGDATKTLGSPIDVLSTHVRMTFYIDPAQTSSNLTSVSIYLNSTNTEWNSFAVIDYTSHARSDSGWYVVTVPIKSISSPSANEDAALSSVTKIRVRLDFPNGQTPTVVMDSIEFIPQPSECLWLFTFDDCKTGCYTAAQHLHSKGIRGTFYAITSLIGTAGYCTLAQLKDMQNMGHLIANHSYSHKYLQTNTLTPDAAVDEIRAATDWLIDNGFSEGAGIFATPGGSSEYDTWTEHVWPIFANTAFVRNTTREPKHIQPEWHFNQGYIAHTCTFDAATDPAIFMTARRLANNPCYITGWHADLNGSVVDAGGVLKSTFTSHVDAIAVLQKAGSLTCVTMDQLA